MAVRAPTVTVLVSARSDVEAAASAATLRTIDRWWPVQWLVVTPGAVPSQGSLRSIVARLPRGDLPVVLWRPAGVPDPDDPLLGWVDHLVVDSRSEGSTADLAPLSAIADRIPLTDLAWSELLIWRELLAALFQGRVFGPFLAGVRHVRVEGDAASARLLAGWLLSRLSGAVRAVEVIASDRMAVEVMAEREGRQSRFSLRWSTDGATVDARAAIVGGPSQWRRFHLQEPDAPRLLMRSLVHLGADPRYVEALTDAVRRPG